MSKETKEKEKLPDGWKWITLGEITKKVSINVLPINYPEAKFIGMDCIQPHSLKPSFTYRFGEFKSSGNYFKTGQVLYGRMRPYLNKVYRAEYDGTCSGEFIVLQCTDWFNPDLLKYILHSRDFVNFTNQKTNGDRPRISYEEIAEYPIALTSISEQRHIVSKIEELFSDLENGKQQLQLAQQQIKIYRQSLLKWAFKGKLTNKCVKEGELPKGWELVKIEDAAISLDNRRKPINKKERLKREGNIPYYGANGRVGWIDDFIFDEPLICVVEDETFTGRTIPFSYKITGKTWVNNHAHVLKQKENINIDFLNYQLSYYPFLPLTTGTTGRKKLTKNALMNAPIKICSLSEQQLIVEELESKLTVCDKLEATISQSLLQAESLRQSILKKAFEGKLVVQQKAVPVYKPKSKYFYQMQLLGLIAKASKQKHIEHGEMTLAKYAFLMDKVYDIPTYLEYKRWHLGPYPPTIKKIINNKQYFKKSGNHIEVLNEKTLVNSTNPYTEKMQSAVYELSDLFSKYTAKERSHKTELLATLCKVIEDIQNTDFESVRLSMMEWKINLKDEKYKTKADKFNGSETEKCIAFIKDKGWDKKLIK